MLLQSIPGSIPWGVFFVYLNDYFSQEKGFSVESATLIVMAFGVAAILSAFLSGLIIQWLYNNKGPRSVPLFTAITIFAGIIPTAFLINYPATSGAAHPNLIPPLIISALSGFVAPLGAASFAFMFMNVNAPETRGSIFSLFNLFQALGNGFGPAVISIFIIGLGRDLALNVANLSWVICGVIVLLGITTFAKDEEALNKTLSNRAEAMLKQNT
jgi:MFS family permease